MMRGNGSLYLAIAILLFSVGIGIHTDLRSSAIERQRTAIDDRLSRVQTLTEAINGMLASAMLEENILRSAGYDTLTEELRTTLRDVRELSGNLRLAPEAERLQEQTVRLLAMQERAVDLMNGNQWLAARAVLSDDTYLRMRKIYEISSELAIIALNSELMESDRLHEQQRLGALWLILLAVVLLLWVGRRHSLRLSDEAGQQARLREALAQAYQELEIKVQERTAELEDANMRLARLSEVDGLSGLANRRKLDDVLEREWQRAARHGEWLAIIMLDIDNFKAYNDNYGHQAGDACIQALSAVLAGSVRRAGDLAARYGGEEFVLVLPGVDLEGARKAAESLRLAFMNLALPHAYSPTAPVVTVSLGVAAAVPMADGSVDSLLRAADEALYAAKRTGRNRVQVAEWLEAA